MTKEFWKPILGYEKYYQVSNKGRIKNIKTKRILKPRVHSNGYLRVCLAYKGIKDKYIHRLVLEAFIAPSNGLECNHIDCDKQNNHLTNLEWVTRTTNVRYQITTGHHNKVKLTPAIVISIRKMYNNHTPTKIIANLLGVRPNAITNIINKETWSYI